MPQNGVATKILTIVLNLSKPVRTNYIKQLKNKTNKNKQQKSLIYEVPTDVLFILFNHVEIVEMCI